MTFCATDAIPTEWSPFWLAPLAPKAEEDYFLSKGKPCEVVTADAEAVAEAGVAAIAEAAGFTSGLGGCAPSF